MKKNHTHWKRYIGKRGMVAKCGRIIVDREWVGSRVRPSCPECRKA